MGKFVIHKLTFSLDETLLLVPPSSPQLGNEIRQLFVLFDGDIKRASLLVMALQVLKVLVPQLIRDAPNESNLIAEMRQR